METKEEVEKREADVEEARRAAGIKNYEMMHRVTRQRRVAEWAALAFGKEEATSIPQRGLRLLEEAIELYQACGCGESQAHDLVTYVFSRPKGEIGQELGGVAVTTLVLAAAAGVSADTEECREINRVMSKPLAHFAERNAAKNAAGFSAIETKQCPRWKDSNGVWRNEFAKDRGAPRCTKDEGHKSACVSDDLGKSTVEDAMNQASLARAEAERDAAREQSNLDADARRAAVIQLAAIKEQLASIPSSHLKHGPGGRGGPGPCDTFCLKCAAVMREASEMNTPTANHVGIGPAIEVRHDGPIEPNLPTGPVKPITSYVIDWTTDLDQPWQLASYHSTKEEAELNVKSWRDTFGDLLFRVSTSTSTRFSPKPPNFGPGGSPNDNLWGTTIEGALDDARRAVKTGKLTRPFDPANPAHYRIGGIEVIDAIDAWDLGFALGNCVKYVARAGRKDPSKTVEDLAKARWYLDHEIARLGGAK